MNQPRPPDEFLVLGSPVISPKAPRKTLQKHIPEATDIDILKYSPVTKITTEQKKIKEDGRPKKIRRGRSLLSDGGRGSKSPVEWENQPHWSEVDKIYSNKLKNGRIDIFAF